MKRLIFYSIALSILCGCDNQQPQVAAAKPQPAETTQSAPTPQPAPQQNGGGIVEHMAGAAVAGAAAGSAGAVAHNLTNRAMDNFDKRRRAKRIAKIRARRR